MLGMPNPRSLIKGQQSESKINHRLISFAVIYPCTSDAHESEIIPHDLTLLRKSPDVIITAMFNSLYGRPHTVRTTVGRPDYLSSPHSNQPNDAMDFGYNQPIIKNTLLLARNILYIIQ